MCCSLVFACMPLLFAPWAHLFMFTAQLVQLCSNATWLLLSNARNQDDEGKAFLSCRLPMCFYQQPGSYQAVIIVATSGVALPVLIPHDMMHATRPTIEDAHRRPANRPHQLSSCSKNSRGLPKFVTIILQVIMCGPS